MADTKRTRDRDRRSPSGRRGDGGPPGSSPDLERTLLLGSSASSLAHEGAGDLDARPAAPRAAGRSIELFVIDDAQLPGRDRKPWHAAEVWTKRRVYTLDSSFECIEVLDRETGRPEPTHQMLGARLGGGRLRQKDTVRFSYPLPLPGMEAMFVKAKGHGYTSAVERMIVRVRVLHTAVGEQLPSWDDVARR